MWKTRKKPAETGILSGAGGGTRTLTNSRAADFESAASAISPLRLKRDAPHQPRTGAGEGNRTLVASLEGWSSAIELRPLNKKPSLLGMAHCLRPPPNGGVDGARTRNPRIDSPVR